MTGKKPHKELSDDERIALYQCLLAKSTDMKLPRGFMNETAEKFGVSKRTVQRIWKRRKDAKTETEVVKELRNRRKGRCGRKRVDVKAVSEALRDVPSEKRRSLRECAEATGFPKSTLWNVLKRGEIGRDGSSKKPLLPDEPEQRSSQERR